MYANHERKFKNQAQQILRPLLRRSPPACAVSIGGAPLPGRPSCVGGIGPTKEARLPSCARGGRALPLSVSAELEPTWEVHRTP